MEITFYTRIPKVYEILLQIIFYILLIITFGFAYILFYDYFFEHKYYLNRRLLLKYLNNNTNTFISKE